MKKSIVNYSLFVFIIMLLLIIITNHKINQTIFFNEINLYQNNMISKLNLLKSQLNDETLIDFKTYFSLNKIYYVEKGYILMSSNLSEKTTSITLKNIQSTEEKFRKNGYLHENTKTFELYYWLSKNEKNGILVVEFDKSPFILKANQLTKLILFKIFMLLAITVIAIFMYNLYNYYVPIYQTKRYLESLDDDFNMNQLEKKLDLKFPRNFNPVILLLNAFFDRIKSKYDTGELDKKMMKLTYDKMRLKNAKFLSLYEFARTLAFDLDEEKIYKKIKSIMSDIMDTKLIVIMIYDEEKKLKITYKFGMNGYEEAVTEKYIEEIKDNLKEAVFIKKHIEDNGIKIAGISNEDKEKIKNLFLIPLIEDSKQYGFIVIDKIFEDKLKASDEIVYLSTLGPIVSKAISQAIQYKKMNQGLNLTSILYNITSLSLSEKDILTIFDEITFWMKRIIDYSSASIFLTNDLDELEEEPEFRVGEENPTLKAIEYTISKHLIKIVEKQSEPIIIKDIGKSNKTIEKMLIEKNIKIVSFASIPMIVNKKLIGVINLTHKEANRFDDEDKNILKVFATQAAATIDKVKKDRKIEELLAKVTNESITDPLTGLYNRRFMMKRLKQELSRSKREGIKLGLLAIDIDFFKKFNDTYGHQTGDLVLETVASLIKRGIRVIDIPCRYGGEEFFVVLVNTTESGIAMIAERLRNSIEATIIKESRGELNVSVSIGTAVYPKDAGTYEEMIKNADLALYKAKETGRNKVVSYDRENEHK